MFDVPGLVTKIDESHLTIESLDNDLSSIYRFGEPFVTIEQFLFDDYYMGKIAKDLYPANVPDLLDIFDSKSNYIEVILTGATSIGKTFMASIAVTYMIGQIGSYLDPHRWLGGSPASPIVLINMSITAQKAKEVVFNRVKTMIDSSPYFREKFQRDYRLQDSLIWYLSTNPKEVVERTGPQLIFKPGTGDSLSALGDDIYAGVGDELNFFRVVEQSKRTHGEALDPAQRLYDTISRRMKGRFSAGGKALGKFFLLSSAQYPEDFVERRINEARQVGDLGTSVKVIRKSLWEAKQGVEVQGKLVYCGKTFRVESGSDRRGSRVLDVYDRATNEVTRKEYSDIEGRILNVPIEWYDEFRRDPEGSVRDLAGEVTRAISPFMTNTDVLYSCFSQAQDAGVIHPWTRDETSLEDGSTLKRDALFQYDEKEAKWVLKRHPGRNRYAHADLATTGDSAGLAIVHISDWKIVMREGKENIEPVYETDLLLRINPPTGGEIKFSKVREIFYTLRGYGMPLRLITYDSWQSVDSIQELETRGFRADTLSVDKDISPYIYLRDCIMDGRVTMYRYEKLLVELTRLEKKVDKVDHPTNGCFTGDTQVSLLDGREVTFEELVKENEEGKTNWVYSLDLQHHCLIPKRIVCPRRTGESSAVVKVELNNGEWIRCTQDHRFMLRDGTYREAKDLCRGDSLMPLYRKLSSNGLEGYELFLDPFTDCWHYTHRHFMGTLPRGHVTHHQNFNKRDNSPPNLKPRTRIIHANIHNNLTKDYSKVSTAVRSWHEKARGTEIYLIRSEKIRKAVQGKPSKLKGKPGKSWTDHQREVMIHRVHLLSCQCISCRSSRGEYVRSELTNQKTRQTLHRLHAEYPEKWEPSRVALQNFNLSLGGRKQHSQAMTRTNELRRNHRVLSVCRLEGKVPVYDLTVEGTENFALTAGVFVHNSKDVADALCGAVWDAFLNESKLSPQNLEALMPQAQHKINPFMASQKANKVRDIREAEDEMRDFMGGSQIIRR